MMTVWMLPKTVVIEAYGLGDQVDDLSTSEVGVGREVGVGVGVGLVVVTGMGVGVTAEVTLTVVG